MISLQNNKPSADIATKQGTIFYHHTKCEPPFESTKGLSKNEGIHIIDSNATETSKALNPQYHVMFVPTVGKGSEAKKRHSWSPR